jgi:nickel-dependent lactate racemase
MDRVILPYGESKIEIPVEADAAPCEYPGPLADIPAYIEKALLEPQKSAPLPDLIPPSGPVAVLVSDLTRGRTAAVMLLELLRFLEERGAGPDRVTVFIAGGMHRGQSAAEIEAQLGTETVSRYRIIQHDARDGDSLLDAGTTSYGTRCLFNREVASSSLVIGVGGVSFHYFAGFGGGRKLILPGISGEETIVANHRRSLREDPGEGLSQGCAPGMLDGNPVHADMLEGASLMPAPVFMVCGVPGAGGEPAFVSAGGMDAAHRLAAEKMLEHFSLPVGSRRRVVIASAGGHPKDINLLQSHKAIRHASRAVEDGGLLLVAASCAEGIGSESLEDAFIRGRAEVPAVVRERYTLNSQAAMSIHEITGRIEVRLFTELDPGTCSRYGFGTWDPAGTSGSLKGMARKDVLVIPDSGSFLPFKK